MFSLFRRFAPSVSLVGTVVLLIGLGLDALLHRVNPESRPSRRHLESF